MGKYSDGTGVSILISAFNEEGTITQCIKRVLKTLPKAEVIVIHGGFDKTAEIADWDYPKLRKVLEELKNKKINLPSLGYCQAELRALLAKQREFDWKAFEDQLKAKLAQVYVLVPIKVPVKMKETFKKAIEKLANEHKIKEKDFAKAAGKVLGVLLGLSQCEKRWQQK